MARREELEKLSRAYVETFWKAVVETKDASKAAFIFEELEFHLACMLLHFTSKAQKTEMRIGPLKPIAIVVSALKVLKHKVEN